MKNQVTKHIGKLAVLLAILATAGWLTAAVTGKESGKAPKVTVSDKPIDRTGRIGVSFAPVVKKVAPSVVNVYSTRTVKMQRFQNPFNELFGDPEARGNRPLTRKAEGSGSGVIVSEDGYILTNNHVVQDADKDGIRVALVGDKTEYIAKVIGTDPQTDIAVVKIEAKKLTPIVLGDSDHIEVGDIVLAVGNPFNVGQSVTMGMVSAMGRGFGILGREGYEDFIQTDAPINPGNSGGALVDVEGRLVGINQSIMSGSGASAGVGFAVPVNLARSIMDRLVTDGKVTRGYLGIKMGPLTPELAQEFKVSADAGVLVDDVMADSPSEKAGVKAGDVITQLNGKKVTDPRHLRLAVSQIAPETKVTLLLIRDGKEKTVTANLAKLPEETQTPRRMNRRNAVPAEPDTDSLQGAVVSDLDASARRQYSVPNNIKGVIITQLEPDSAEAKAGLKVGDVIVEIDKKPVKTAEEAVTLSKPFDDKRMMVRVWSPEEGAGLHYVVVDNTKKK